MICCLNNGNFSLNFNGESEVNSRGKMKSKIKKEAKLINQEESQEELPLHRVLKQTKSQKEQRKER